MPDYVFDLNTRYSVFTIPVGPGDYTIRNNTPIPLAVAADNQNNDPGAPAPRAIRLQPDDVSDQFHADIEIRISSAEGPRLDEFPKGDLHVELLP